MQGNDIGLDRVMTFSEVRDEVCRVVRLVLTQVHRNAICIPGKENATCISEFVRYFMVAG